MCTSCHQEALDKGFYLDVKSKPEEGAGYCVEDPSKNPEIDNETNGP